MERNIDKIKRLQHELGRYQKKVADQAKELAKLKEGLHHVYLGEREVQRGVDAILAQTALTYGKAAMDEDNEGTYLGHRLTLPAFSVGDILSKYEVRARKDEETGAYIVGVVPREEAEE